MDKYSQKIMCIPSDVLFEKGKWQGLKTENKEFYIDLINSKYEFRVRGELEEDPTFKQVIVQAVIKYGGKYLLHKQNSGGDKRIEGMHILPLGGHVEEFDKGENMILTAMHREMEEEAEINANIINEEFKGLVYLENENPINAVHVGLVYFIEVDSDDARASEEGLENIGFVDKNFLNEIKSKTTYWSQIIIDDLILK